MRLVKSFTAAALKDRRDKLLAYCTEVLALRAAGEEIYFCDEACFTSRNLDQKVYYLSR